MQRDRVKDGGKQLGSSEQQLTKIFVDVEENVTLWRTLTGRRQSVRWTELHHSHHRRDTGAIQGNIVKVNSKTYSVAALCLNAHIRLFFP